MLGLGIMSGSSLDGLDFALVQIENGKWDFVDGTHKIIPLDLKERLATVSEISFKDLLQLERDYSRFVAQCIQELDNWSFEFVSVHGHTSFHLPQQEISHQLCDGALVSAHTRMKVICDFRKGDISLGGVGTPLIPILEKDLLTAHDYYLNLGGIANITKSKDWTAFDVCPCNQLSNFLTRSIGLEYDEDGKRAALGGFQPKLYDSLDQFEYFKQSPPKSLDNNWIRDNYFNILSDSSYSLEDRLHTVSHWIADKICDVVKEGRVYCTGGGCFNKYLLECLRDKGLDLILPSKELIEFKEAILMVYLGYLRLRNLPNILCSVTGSSIDNVGGAIYNIHGR